MGRKFCIASQFVANDLKLAVENHLKSLGHEVIDLITDEERETISFTVVAQKMAKAITSGEYELGFLFCGSGMGVSQIANKYRGVRAALVESPLFARAGVSSALPKPVYPLPPSLRSRRKWPRVLGLWDFDTLS